MRNLHRCAALSGDAVERAGELIWENNSAVRAPISTATSDGIAQHNGRAAVHRDFLQFSVNEKTDPLAVRGKKRRARSRRAIQLHGSHFVQLAHVELICAGTGLVCYVRETRPIG